MSQRAQKKTRHVVRQRKARARQRMIGLVSVGVVVVIVAVLVLVKVVSGPPSSGPSSAVDGTNVLSSVSEGAITNMSASVLDDVGVPSTVSGVQRVRGKLPILRSSGEPSVVFIGAEYCPFCAAERWGLTVALSRFGTFQCLRATHSSSTDEYPDTPTLSFYGSRYISKYLHFTSVELNTNEVVNGSYQPLQRLNAMEQSLVNTFDAPPYTSQTGTIPFIDIGNQYVDNGASYDPQDLHGMTVSEVASELKLAKSQTAQDIGGTANLMTGAICSITKDQPSAVCDGPAVRLAMSKLGTK